MQAPLFKKKFKMAGACIYLFWWKKNDISGLIENSDAENTKKTKKIRRFPYVFKKLWYKLFDKQFCEKQ